jgi:hypothetical protein
MQEYANIITQAPRTPTLPDKIPGTHNPDWTQLVAVGWRKLDERTPVTPPDGLQVTRWVYSQDPERAECAIEEPWFDAIPEAVPARFESGIDSTILVLDAPDGSKGIGYAPADDGTLIPIVYVHESPYDMAAVAAKVAAARVAHGTRKAGRVIEAADIESKAAAAGNSIPALRAEVVRLAKLAKQLAGG